MRPTVDPLRVDEEDADDEDVLQSLLPGQLSPDFLMGQLSAIVQRSVGSDTADSDEDCEHDVRRTDAQSRLFQACMSGDIQMAKQAIGDGADPNANLMEVPVRKTKRLGTRFSCDNKRPHVKMRQLRRLTEPALFKPNILLHLVVMLGDTEMTELLLDNKASPARQDALGDTALHVVCRALHPLDVTIELVRLLRDAGAPLEQVNNTGLTPLQLAAYHGNTAALLTLAEYGAECRGIDGRGNSLLHAAVISGSAQAVSAVLDRIPASDVQLRNKGGATAIQLATSREVVRQLLAAGAVADEPTVLTLLKSAPPAVSDVLDNYMSTNGESLDSSTLNVYIDYTPFWDDNRPQPGQETNVLRAIVDADQDNLLKHPVIETFLHIKWQQICKFFYFNFVFYACFSILCTAYALMRVNMPDDMSTSVMACFTGAFTLFMAFRETFQMAYSFRLYVSSVENWLELLVIVLTTVLLAGHGWKLAWLNHVVAWLLLAVWLDMTLMVGRFPSIGIYIYMFVRVAQKLIQFILVYSTLLVAFALSFHVLFTDAVSFKTIPLALIKTFVMMMGEYDYDGMFGGPEALDYPGTSHLLILIFVVLMSIITVNLLIGLTVNDIQGLFKTAGVQRLRTTVIQILYIESVIYSNILHTLFRTRICQRMRERVTFLPKLRMRWMDRQRHGSRPPDDKNGHTETKWEPDLLDVESAVYVIRVSFRPNKRDAKRIYRVFSSGEERPTPFMARGWMLRNMLNILREREADDDRATREQLLQTEILAAVRAKTTNPFWTMQVDDAAPDVAGDTQPAAAGDGETDRQREMGGRSRVGRRRRKKAVSGQTTMEDMNQKLNTILAAVSELSLKMGLLERRLNLIEAPKLDTFYSV